MCCGWFIVFHWCSCFVYLIFWILKYFQLFNKKSNGFLTHYTIIAFFSLFFIFFMTQNKHTFFRISFVACFAKLCYTFFRHNWNVFFMFVQSVLLLYQLFKEGLFWKNLILNMFLPIFPTIFHGNIFYLWL